MDNSTKTISLYNGKVEIKFYGPTPEKPNRHMYFVNGKRMAGVTTFIGILDKSKPLQSWQQRITVDFLLKSLDKGIVIDHDRAIEAAVQNEIQFTKATGLGTKIHEWVEGYIKSKIKKGVEIPEMPKDKAVQNGVNAFLDWEEQQKPKFVLSEKVVYSKKHGYIGTLDIGAKIVSKRMLIDLKSSNGLYNSVRLQTAGYVGADTEESGVKYDGRWALRVSKSTEEEYYAEEKRKAEIKTFIANYRGKDAKIYPPKPYQIFEAKYLDDEPDMMDYDFKHFIAAMNLYRWNQKTDFFLASRKK